MAGDPRTIADTLLGSRADVELASTHVSLAGQHLRYRIVAPDGTRVVDREVSVHLDGTSARWTNVSVLDDQPAPFQLVGQRRISQASAEAKARELVTEGRITKVSSEAVALPSKTDRDVVRAGYRAIVETRQPAHGWEVWVDGDGNAELIRDTYRFVNGTGYVFDPNPLATTGSMSMVDGNDATTSEIDAARYMVTLPRLDGTGVLKGQWADVKPVGTRTTNANHQFLFNRSQVGFEETNVYYHLDAAQAKIQALGFTNANNRVQVATVNEGNQDNSFYSPSDKEVSFGAGGVDDAEDADIVIHEYGHSVQDNIVPGYGTSAEAGAMGEGFGDLLAASLEPINPANTQVVNRACVGTWDAISYDTASPPCLRRLDTAKHWPESGVGQVHADGEIWSGGMWNLYTLLGDRALGTKLVIEAFFRVSPSVTFAQYSAALLEADMALHAGANIPKIKRALWERGLYRIPEPQGGFTGTPTSVAVSLGPTGAIPNNADSRLTINHPGAGAIRVHFSTFNMSSRAQCLDRKCDNVYIFDGNGVLYAILGGNLGATDGPIVPGDTVVVRWVTDDSTQSTGFHIDRYDHGAAGMPQPDAGVDAGVTTDAAVDAAVVDDGSVPDGSVDPDGGTDVDASVPGPDGGDDNPNEGDGDGGCCSANDSTSSSALLVGFLGLAWITRRPRRRRAG